MRPATLLRLLLGLAYAATAGWLLYDYSDEAASLLRGRWLKELWPGAETVIRVSWLYDLRIIAVPLYASGLPSGSGSGCPPSCRANLTEPPPLSTAGAGTRRGGMI